jgi:hypothetical protein
MGEELFGFFGERDVLGECRRRSMALVHIAFGESVRHDLFAGHQSVQAVVEQKWVNINQGANFACTGTYKAQASAVWSTDAKTE